MAERSTYLGSRDQLREQLGNRGYTRTSRDNPNYETWKLLGSGQTINIRPNGEVIPTRNVPRQDGQQGKFLKRYNWLTGEATAGNAHNTFQLVTPNSGVSGPYGNNNLLKPQINK